MFSIGLISVSNHLVLAPLAGYSDLPFRRLCRKFGAGLCVSEMISCHGLLYQQAKTLSMLQTCIEEKPVSFQLFGADAGVMGDAAALLDSFHPDIIDINMGCPVKKVTKRGAGAALMGDIKKAETIIKKVVYNSSCPVTVKFRSGTDNNNLTADEFGRMAEASGAEAVTIHGRSWKQAFSGQADWSMVKKVKQSVRIPVIGNGDVTCRSEANDRMKETNCDAVMIGRAALGNPWAFHAEGRPGTLQDIVAGVQMHIELIELYCVQPQVKLASLKNHLGKYFRGFPGSSSLRQQIYAMSNWSELKTLLGSLA